MIFFEDETSFEGDFNPQEVAEEVVSFILKEEACPFDYEINLMLTDEEAIQRLNRDFRGIDSVTDVLSFPNMNFLSPGDFQGLRLDDKVMRADCFDPESGNLLLGDMVICTERMASQAEEYGHSLKREFAFLTAHSVLHLIGYDHMEPEDAELMEMKQKQYLDKLGIHR